MTEYRKLRRQKAIVAGVCGGLGVFFGWFRLLFLLLLIPGGLPGILPYVILWIMIPRKW